MTFTYYLLTAITSEIHSHTSLITQLGFKKSNLFPPMPTTVQSIWIIPKGLVFILLPCSNGKPSCAKVLLSFTWNQYHLVANITCKHVLVLENHGTMEDTMKLQRQRTHHVLSIIHSFSFSSIFGIKCQISNSVMPFPILLTSSAVGIFHPSNAHTQSTSSHVPLFLKNWTSASDSTIRCVNCGEDVRVEDERDSVLLYIQWDDDDASASVSV